tara:strand:+ start:24155 stop:24874 length:720 start_codon:yes stop_codon:yes gene_type:complete
MALFRRETLQHEQLPDQIVQNNLIEGWFSEGTGALAWLKVDGTARSAEEEERMWLHIGGSFVISLTIGILGQGRLAEASIEPVGFFLIAMMFVIWPLWLRRIVRGATGERVFWIDTETIQLDRLGSRSTFTLDQVIGVTLSQVDQQKLDDEQWKKLKNRKPNSKERPKLLQPYSRQIDLQTDLGCIPLGAIYGIERATNISNAINTGLAYMKGRSGTGKQPAVDARFQYRTGQAGQIPD